MRLGCYSLDRPEMQFKAKECARGLSWPAKRSEALLQRAPRFSLTAFKAVWRVGRQRTAETVGDWAEQKHSKKYERFALGTHVADLKYDSLKQNSTAWIVVLRDCLGLVLWRVTWATHSTCGCEVPALLRLASRIVVDAEHVRHLETPTLWVQTAMKDKKFVVNNVPGKLNTCTTHANCSCMIK